MVEGQTYYIEYVTNSATFQFPYPFYLWEFSDLLVQYTPAGGTPINLQLDVDYQLTGINDEFGCFPDGVTVTTQGPNSPLAAGTLLFTRYTQRTQLNTWIDNSPFPAVQEEAAFDKLTLMIQEISQNFLGFLAGPPATGSVGNWFIVYPAIAGTFWGYIYTTTGWKQFAPISF